MAWGGICRDCRKSAYDPRFAAVYETDLGIPTSGQISVSAAVRSVAPPATVSWVPTFSAVVGVGGVGGVSATSVHFSRNQS